MTIFGHFPLKPRTKPKASSLKGPKIDPTGMGKRAIHPSDALATTTDIAQKNMVVSMSLVMSSTWLMAAVLAVGALEVYRPIGEVQPRDNFGQQHPEPRRTDPMPGSGMPGDPVDRQWLSDPKASLHWLDGDLPLTCSEPPP